MLINSVTETEPATQPISSPLSEAKPHSTTNVGTDTVQVSSAAQTASSPYQIFFKEAIATPAQIAQEARDGDPVAQRIIAKEEAAEKAAEQ